MVSKDYNYTDSSWVICTPVYLENSDQLTQNMRSVECQTLKELPLQHMLINDGIINLALRNKKPKRNAVVLSARYNHSDYGDYIRRLGTKIALINGSKAISYLDADNYLHERHLETVYDTHINEKKNIVISKRNLVDEQGLTLSEFETDFYDTNTITLFGEHKKIGLLWGMYPRELSIIGDRIVSKYIRDKFADQIAYTDTTTVIYRYSKISKEKTLAFKSWYEKNYHRVAQDIKTRFGFEVKI